MDEYYSLSELDEWFEELDWHVASRAFGAQAELVEDAFQEFWLFTRVKLISRRYSIKNRFMYFARAYSASWRKRKHFTSVSVEGVDFALDRNTEDVLIEAEQDRYFEEVINSLTPKQAITTKLILREGLNKNMVELWQENRHLAPSYNTFKANFRHAITSLKSKKLERLDFFVANEPQRILQYKKQTKEL